MDESEPSILPGFYQMCPRQRLLSRRTVLTAVCMAAQRVVHQKYSDLQEADAMYGTLFLASKASYHGDGLGYPSWYN